MFGEIAIHSFMIKLIINFIIFMAIYLGILFILKLMGITSGVVAFIIGMIAVAIFLIKNNDLLSRIEGD